MEGFDPVTECPNTSPAEGEDAVRESVDEKVESLFAEITDDLDRDLVNSDLQSASPVRLEIGGDQSLNVQEASSLAARSSATVILVAGEAESGKTTLLVELYAQFLLGAFADWSFGGSETLVALERRHAAARASSGRIVPTTERTQDEDMRFLHFRLGKNGSIREVLVSDLRGELFENVRNGADVRDQVPVAIRADKSIVLVDGEQLIKPGTRGAALFHLRQLVGGLVGPGGVRPNSPLAIICAKADMLPAAVRDEVHTRLSAMAEEFGNRAEKPAVFILTARSDDATTSRASLKALFEWMIASDDATARNVQYQNSLGDRQFWREPPIGRNLD